MTKPLTVGGLFSGIGGWELGLERAGMEIAWHCEADPFCRRVLEHHWPGVPCFEDVCTLNAGMAEGVDVLCGGFPCQDISLAGKGAGIDGARSGLWSEFARLIGELRPQYVLVENVSALLGRGLDRVLGDLAALGFDAEWDCIPASAVGASHRRDRVWIVAYPGCERGTTWRGARHVASTTGEGQGNCEQWQRYGDAANDRRPDMARTVGDPFGERCKESRNVNTRALSSERGERERSWPGAWLPEPPVGRVAYGISARVVGPQLRALGNALVPQIAEWIGQGIVAYEAST